jgi:hypothetical protein
MKALWPSGLQPRVLPVVLIGAVILSCLITTFFFSSFTADDSYIMYRYAENLVNLGRPVFNVDEPVAAFTSPLLLFLEAFLYRVTGTTLLPYKIVAAMLFAVAAFIVVRSSSRSRETQALALALIILPPCVILWTLGGLETPILLFLQTILVVVFYSREDGRPRPLVWLYLLGGLAFLTRYDSILFTAPIILFASAGARPFSRVLIAAVVGAVLPLTWLIFAQGYYGSILPTSFYVKTPELDRQGIVTNGLYVLQWLFLTGHLPVAAFAVARIPASYRVSVLRAHLRQFAWLYPSIGLMLLYGLSMARAALGRALGIEGY